MDIDLLSKMVKEIILDHDEVTLPGVGTFVAELVPASFTDKGYIINPPYRRLYFVQSKDGQDEAIANLYASSNGVSFQDAEAIVNKFLSEMKSILEEKKFIIFPGLGRLRATKENNFFFVADEDLDIFPSGFGLEPVSLRTHEESREEVSAAIRGISDIIEAKAASPRDVAGDDSDAEQAREAPAEVVSEAPAEKVSEAPAEEASEAPAEAVSEAPAEEVSEAPAEKVSEAPAEADTEPVAETAAEQAQEAPAEQVAVAPVAPSESAPVAKVSNEATAPGADTSSVINTTPAADSTHTVSEISVSQEDTESEPKPAKNMTGIWKALIWIAAILLFLLLTWILLGHLAPDFIDRFLFNEDELEIINNTVIS
jgi:hypothetical protein